MSGRVAVEKNVEAFLHLDLPGHANGSSVTARLREALEQRYPQVISSAPRRGEELAGATMQRADVFVFPSRTDTFGLVMLEAMACGMPVAAYPVKGPIDVVANGRAGVLDEDLQRACQQALALPREQVRAHALGYSWETASGQFLQHLRPVRA